MNPQERKEFENATPLYGEGAFAALVALREKGLSADNRSCEECVQLKDRNRILTDLLKECRVAFEELDNLLGRGTEPLITQAIQNIDMVIE